MILDGPSGRRRQIADDARTLTIVCAGTRKRPHDPETVAVWFEVPGRPLGGLDAPDSAWQLVHGDEQHRQRLRLSCTHEDCPQAGRFVAGKVHRVAAKLVDLGVPQVDLSSLSDAYERAARYET